MVVTRLSTGSLPTPKRKNLIDSSESDDEDVEDFAQPMQKRAKLEEDEYSTDSYPKRKNGSCSGRTIKKKERSETLQANPEDNGPNVELKLRRMEGLLTGPESKALWKPMKKREIKTPKSQVGKLAGILDLPVDVFCEIASHLTILDILNISRASRSLHELLMSKSSRTIWLASIAGTGLPTCPEDLNEPQYANLFFEKFCHGCGYSRVERVELNLRIRLCKGCAKLNIIRGSTIAKKQFGPNVVKQHEIYTLVPWRRMSFWDFEDTAGPKLLQRYYLRSEFVHIVRQYLSFRPESDERAAFVRERRRILEESLQHKEEMEEWRSRKREEKRIAERERSRPGEERGKL